MNLAHEIEAYAAYLNAPRHEFDDDELEHLDEDTATAREAHGACVARGLPHQVA